MLQMFRRANQQASLVKGEYILNKMDYKIKLKNE